MKTFDHIHKPLTRQDVVEGLIVRVVREPRIDDPHWGDSWVPRMTDWIEHYAVITEGYPHHAQKVRLRLLRINGDEKSITGEAYNFPIFTLENTGEYFPLPHEDYTL